MWSVHVDVKYIFVSLRNEKFSGVRWVRRCHLTEDWYIHHVWRLRNQTGSEIFRQHYNCRRGTSHVSPPHYMPAPYQPLHVYAPFCQDHFVPQFQDDLQHHNFAEWIVLFVCLAGAEVSGFTAVTLSSVWHHNGPALTLTSAPGHLRLSGDFLNLILTGRREIWKRTGIMSILPFRYLLIWNVQIWIFFMSCLISR